MHEDKRLIEDYLPIEAISAEGSREKNVRKGHISTLHLWWARRPLVACRAAVYGALVPADRWVKAITLKNPPLSPGKAEQIANGKKKGLNRKAASDFVTALCKYPGDPRIIDEARRHILEAHRDYLSAVSAERAKASGPPVLDKDGESIHNNTPIEKVPPPKVLDIFAGGGTIPLEALRLGCEAYALDLNPVAHLIQLCTLVYPQKCGKPDPKALGMTGPRNAKGDVTWGGLAEEVSYWGKWVLHKVRCEIGDLYPPLPDPSFKGKIPEIEFDRAKGTWVEAPRTTKGSKSEQQVLAFANKEDAIAVPTGHLQPVAYLWTRTVKCKNPSCCATVPLLRQSWLCKKEKRYVAMKLIAPKGATSVTFQVVESSSEQGLGFDPESFSKGGNATCPFCGTVADNDYVRGEGLSSRMGCLPMCAVGIRPGTVGKVYIGAAELPGGFVPSPSTISTRLNALLSRSGLTVPDEPTPDHMVGGGGNCRNYGITKWGEVFSPRQQLALLSFCEAVRAASRCAGSQSDAIATVLAACVGKFADFNSTECTFNYTGGRGVKNSFARQSLPIVWDYAESDPFNPDGASWPAIMKDLPTTLAQLPATSPAIVHRGSALSIPWEAESFDAVITDPPYYDNVGYAILSDFFYVWEKRILQDVHAEHFSGIGTPKKQEAIADPGRHGGDRTRANREYEAMMLSAFRNAHHVLRPGGTLVVVYAHKTTLGWSTLVDSLRNAGFMVTEAWPLDTEKAGRVMSQDAAALASSIFLVSRKRDASINQVGAYENDVRVELIQIVRERVETLWDMGISGADLVIAAVGAGLRAFTRYERVEYANGEEVPAERFLAEVEGVVLDTILRRLSKETGSNGGGVTLAGVDESTRFYVLWRYAYRVAPLGAGEAIIFANGTHVELDGQHGLSNGSRAVVEKKKSQYRLKDFTERGGEKELGLRDDDDRPAPLIDVLHRLLWLLENRPRGLEGFLMDARPDRERLRLVAQALAGSALSGGSQEDADRLVGTTTAEQAALDKLLANWKSLVPESLFEGGKR